jgi:hypothetical protein
MKQIVSYKPYNYQLTVHLSTWFPFFNFVGWSITLLRIAFVKYTYWMNQGKETNMICWDITPEQDAQGLGSTHRTMMHEYSHLVLKNQIGSWHYFTWCIWDYMRFWIKHDDKPIEQRVEQIRLTLTNPY